MAPINGIANVKQKERIVAALRPPQPSSVTGDTPTLLSLLPPVAIRPASTWEHGIAHLDASGRIKDSAIFTSLGWTSETRFSLLIQDDSIQVRPGNGDRTLDSRGRITIPDHMRSILGLAAGDGVLCSRDLRNDQLVIRPVRCCDELVEA